MRGNNFVYDPDTDEYLYRRPPKRAGRVCAGEGCGTILNRYNTEDYCGACRIRITKRHSAEVRPGNPSFRVPRTDGKT
ncbi:MAG TPA: hypothetical protein VD862_00885 [Candidatus Paceibacterota bacterium]|nr:hypothetical protein [Candidatus Paceibacterota bacterium]